MNFSESVLISKNWLKPLDENISGLTQNYEVLEAVRLRSIPVAKLWN